MALFSLLSEYVGINGVDESAFCKQAELTVDAAELDTTDFASGGWKEVIGGMKSAGLAISLMDDVAASQIDSRIWALFGTVTTFEIRATNAVVGASNPKWTGSVLVSHTKIGGSVGDLAMKSGLNWPTSGVVTRAVA